MPETALGIVYPDSGGHTRLWEHFQALAESVDPLFQAIPASQFGSASVSTASSGIGDQVVNLDNAFVSAPVVFTTIQNRALQWTSGASSIGVDSFNIWVRNAASGSGTVTVAWVAIGQVEA